MKKFQPPTDTNQWWLAPHCGPGSKNVKDICGFCGENVIDCALEATKVVNEQHIQPGDGDECKDGEGGCGGSGFWCLGCKRFWAQDSCGGSDREYHRAADGAELKIVDGFVTCVCGRKLMKEWVKQ